MARDRIIKVINIGLSQSDQDITLSGAAVLAGDGIDVVQSGIDWVVTNTGGSSGGGGIPSSRQIIAGAGLTGGGTLAADRTIDIVAADASIQVNANSIAVGTITESQVTGLVADLASKVSTATTITAGNGLTGGGDLSTNRTINIVPADGTIQVNADSIQVGTIAQSQVTNLVTDLAGKLSSSVTLTAGDGLTGGGDLSTNRTFNVVANADGSIVVNANDIQVGVISDTQHGSRGGSSLHALVISSGNAGFMSGTDKAKLDAIPTPALGSGRRINTTAGELTGGGTLATDLQLGLANTAVTSGVYISPTITIDGKGRITAATSGSTTSNVVTGIHRTGNSDVFNSIELEPSTNMTITQTGQKFSFAATGGSSGSLFTDTYLADGVSQIGWSAGQYTAYFTEGMTITEWALQSGGISSNPNFSTDRGGVIRTNYTGSAGSSSMVLGEATTTNLSIKGSTTSDKWYMAMKAKIVDNSTDGVLSLGFCINDSAILNFNNSLAQVYKNAGTSKYRAQLNDGSHSITQDSTIGIDNNYHLFRLWFDGSNVHFAVDAETPISFSVGAVTLGKLTVGMAATGGTSTACNIFLDAGVWMADWS